MKKRLCTLMMLLAALVMTAYAQKARPTTANYIKACEAIDSSDYEVAYPLLLEELKIRPKDGYVWKKISEVYISQYEIDSAMIALNNAITYLPKKEKEEIAGAYSTRSVINFLSENYDDAMTDCTALQQLTPEDETSYYIKAAIYKSQEKYAESDAELKKLLNIYGVNKVDAYSALASNVMERGDYAQALTYCDQAYELDQTSLGILTTRSKAHLGLNHEKEAINDAILACKYDNEDEDGFSHLTQLANDDSRRSTVIARIKKELETTDRPAYWNRALYSIYHETPNKAEALRYLIRSYKAEPNFATARNLYSELADAKLNQEAYHFSNQLLQLCDDDDEEERMALRIHRCDLLSNEGKTQEAIDTLNALREQMDSKALVDIRSAYMLLNDKKPEEAIQYMKKVDDSDYKTDSYWGMMARMYKMTDQQDCLWLCTELSRYHTTDLAQTLYSYALNGDKEQTLKVMREKAENFNDSEDEEDEETVKPEMSDKEVESVIAENMESPYDLACIYALINEKEKAIDYLTQALKNGWKDFKHIENDTDLDNIRGETSFISTVKMYQSMAEKEKQEMRDIYQEEMPN